MRLLGILVALVALFTAGLATAATVFEYHVVDPPAMTTVVNGKGPKTVVQDPPPITVTDADEQQVVYTTVEGGTKFGFAAHIFETTQAGADAHVALLKSAGARYIRDDFAWSWSEGQRGVYDFSRIDRIARAARRYRMKLVPQIGFAPAWANGGQNDKVGPINVADFGAWARALGAHLKANHSDVMLAVTIWNEPNLSGFLSEPSRAGQEASTDYYVALHNAGYDGIKAVYPELQVWCCDQANLGYRVWDESPMTWMEEVLSKGVKFDAVAVHPYFWGQAGPTWDDGFTPDESVNLTWPNTFARVFRGPDATFSQETLREQLARHGYPNVKIHATEIGQPTDRPDGSPAYRGTSEANQAEWFRRAYAWWDSQPQAGIFFFYTPHDTDSWDTADPEHHFGAWRSDGTEKPVVTVMKEVT